MRYSASILAAAAALSGTALAEDFNQTCSKPGDVRQVEVRAPGDVGASCDVRYTRSSGGVATPYHADNAPVSYCLNSAKELVANLKAAGFTCAAVFKNVAQSSTSASKPTQQVGKVELTSHVVSVTDGKPEAESGSVDEALLEVVAEEAKDEPSVELTEVEETTLEEPALAEKVANTVAAPDEAAASTAPAQLTSASLEVPVETKTAASSVGRLVGAAPEPSPAQQSPGTPENVSTAGQAVTPVTQASAKKSVMRAPEDTIKATLAAQAAAWNEGNLDAFMSIYDKSDNTKFVSGVEVTKGWSATMKHYRETYGSDQGFGKLGFDKMDVQLVTADVAIVTGRFNLVNGDAASSGLFSLVMRQQGGVWRIVYDHTSIDPPVE